MQARRGTPRKASVRSKASPQMCADLPVPEQWKMLYQLHSAAAAELQAEASVADHASPASPGMIVLTPQLLQRRHIC